MKSGLLRLGLALLAPAPFVFAVRAYIAATGGNAADVPGLGIVTAISGVLSLTALAILIAAAWPTKSRHVPLLATVVVLVGHFVVSPWIAPVGSAMVYAGTGLAGTLRRTWALVAGGVAAAGALMRLAEPGPAEWVVAVGALWLGIELLLGAARGRAARRPATSR